MDLNIISAVKLASGKYCWIIGSDDLLNLNAIKTVFHELNKNEGISIFLSNRLSYYTTKKETLIYSGFLKENGLGRIFDFNNSNHFEEYLKKAVSIGAVFSYISTIIFLRTDWVNSSIDNSFIGSCYNHSAKLLAFIQTGKLKYLKEILILNQQGNDSWMKLGYKEKIFLDFNGYLRISNLISNGYLQQLFVKILKKEQKLFNMIYQYSLDNFKLNKSEKNTLLKIGYNKFLVNIIYYGLAPKKMIKYPLKIYIIIMFKVKKFLSRRYKRYNIII